MSEQLVFVQVLTSSSGFGGCLCLPIMRAMLVRYIASNRMSDIVIECDWRKQNVLAGPVPLQNAGTCYAHTTAGIIQADLEVQRAAKVPQKAVGVTHQIAVGVTPQTAMGVTPCPQESIDCCKDPGNSNGGNVLDSLDRIMAHGITDTMHYPVLDPYFEARGTCLRCEGESKGQFKPTIFIGGYQAKKISSPSDLKDVVRKRPVAVSLNVGDDFQRYNVGPGDILYSGVYDKADETRNIEAHAMIIVGFGYYRGSGGIEPFWIVRNSYGPEWGDNGFVYLHQKFTSMFNYVAWTEGARVVSTV